MERCARIKGAILAAGFAGLTVCDGSPILGIAPSSVSGLVGAAGLVCVLGIVVTGGCRRRTLLSCTEAFAGCFSSFHVHFETHVLIVMYYALRRAG